MILHFKHQWERLSAFVTPQGSIEERELPTLSVLIPARNEESNIGALLEALLAQQFPGEKVEIIVIDDHSTDSTAAIAGSFLEVRVLSLREEGLNSYKKKALEKGVQVATGDLIVCTDADCIPGPYWLASIAGCYQQKTPAFIAAPVVLTNNGSLLGQFQTLDFLVMQGITGAGIQSRQLYMANGANLAYPKTVFNEVNGYKNVDQLASGDDFFLLHKIAARYPEKIVYLQSEEAIVETPAQQTWKDFIQQRIRWASKSTQYRDRRITTVLSIVWLYNAFLILLFTGGLLDERLLLAFLTIVFLKAIVEWPFVKIVARFFKIRVRFIYFLAWQPIHICYIVFTGLAGLQPHYVWKGRKVR